MKKKIEKKDTSIDKDDKKEEVNNKEKEIKEEIEEDISQEKLDKIKEEIKKTKKEIKSNPKIEKTRKNILRNLLIAIVVTVYFIFINLGIKAIPVTEYMLDLKTFAIFIVIIAIVIFERAYKKDENYLAIHGIETVVVGIETLILLQLYSVKSEYLNYVLCGITLGMILYYFLKSLVIFIKEKVKKK